MSRELALITGASSGIGAAIARSLARRGYDVVLTARREDRLEALSEELEAAHSITAHVIAADLGEPGGALRLYDGIGEAGLAPSVVVNNAGFGIYGPHWRHPPARSAQMLELNVVALTHLTHLFAADMVGRGSGFILNVSSVGAFTPSPLYAAYSATKAYGLWFGQAMDWELKDLGTGVSVTTLCPGLTATEFHEVADHLKPKALDRMMMTSAEVAEAGVRAMLARRAVVTPGAMNVMTGWILKLLPRSWGTAMAGTSMKGKR